MPMVTEDALMVPLAFFVPSTPTKSPTLSAAADELEVVPEPWVPAMVLKVVLDE